MKPLVTIMWFRRDLRLEDNAALYYALKTGFPVVPVFIFDRNILDDLEYKNDRRVTFIYKAITDLQQQLVNFHSSLEVYYGFPAEVFKGLLSRYDITAVFTNHDYEQYAIDRDEEINHLLAANSISFNTYKDQVIFEKNEVVKDDGKPYTVFTPYGKKWKACLNDFYTRSYATEKYLGNFFKQPPIGIPALPSMGFEDAGDDFPSKLVREELIRQ